MSEHLITPEHVARLDELFDAEIATAAKSKTHLWVATHAYRVSVDNLLDTDAPLITDAENLRVAAIGCYVCEEPFSRRLARRKCQGEPRPRRNPRGRTA